MRTPTLLLSLWCTTAPATAQEERRPAPPARPPAFTLLVRRAPELESEAVRTRLTRVLGTEVRAGGAGRATWLDEDDRGLRGSHDGVAFTIRVTDAPLALTPAMLEHLDDAAADTLRSHRAQVVIAAEAARAERTKEDHRVLGQVAAAMLDEQVVGIGARHHDTFEVVDEDTAGKLTGDDPFAAFEAQRTTSLVVFLRNAWALDEAMLRSAFEKEFAVRLATDGDATDDFVVGRGEGGVLKLRGDLVLLSVRPRYRGIDKLTGPVRDRLRPHRALLHVAVTGPAGKEADRRRLVARTVAALWDHDCLGLNWHCDPAIALGDGDTVANLRKLDPVVATIGNPVARDFDPQAMSKAIERARQTWSQAADRLAAGGEVSAKFPFAARSGGHEHIWITVTRIDGDQVHGTIANDPADIEGVQLGSAVVCKLAELSDWMFLRDGERVGGFTVEVLEREAERRRGSSRK